MTYPVGKKVYASYMRSTREDAIDMPGVISKVLPEPYAGERQYEVAFADGWIITLNSWHLSERKETSSAYRFMRYIEVKDE